VGFDAGHDPIADRKLGDLRTGLVDDAGELGTEDPPLREVARLERVSIRPGTQSALDVQNHVRRFLDFGPRNVADLEVRVAVVHECSHE